MWTDQPAGDHLEKWVLVCFQTLVQLICGLKEIDQPEDTYLCYTEPDGDIYDSWFLYCRDPDLLRLEIKYI